MGLIMYEATCLPLQAQNDKKWYSPICAKNVPFRDNLCPLLFFVVSAPVPNFENGKNHIIFVNFVNNPVSITKIKSHLTFIFTGEFVSYVGIHGEVFYYKW